MVKFKLWTCLLLAGLYSTAANAAPIDFSQTDITSSSRWVASSDNYGKVFANNYSTENGVAEMTETSNFFSNLLNGQGTNSILYSVSLEGISAGSYNWSVDTLYSSFIIQYNFGQVYLVKDGQKIDLDTNIWNKTTRGSTIISQVYPGLFTGDEEWHTFGSDFNLSENQISEYDALAIVLSGSKCDGQILEYNNITSNVMATANACVPEPATIALVGSGSLWVLFRKRHKA